VGMYMYININIVAQWRKKRLVNSDYKQKIQRLGRRCNVERQAMQTVGAADGVVMQAVGVGGVGVGVGGVDSDEMAGGGVGMQRGRGCRK